MPSGRPGRLPAVGVLPPPGDRRRGGTVRVDNLRVCDRTFDRAMCAKDQPMHADSENRAAR